MTHLDRITSILKGFPNHRFTVSQIAKMLGVVYEDAYKGKNLEQRCAIIYLTMRNQLVQGKPSHVFQDDIGYRKYWFDPDNIHIPSREEKVAAVIEDEMKEQEHTEEEEEISDAGEPIEYVLPEDCAIAELLHETAPEEKKSIWKKVFG
jgi:hypothetical protein